MVNCPNNCNKDYIIRKLPDWYDTSRENRTISIDKCLVRVIEALWDAKIEILGNCCGHFGRSPSIILGNNVLPDEILLAKSIANKLLPDEHLQFVQWQLCNI